ncbi:MAG: type II secretion system protein [Lachnospiraceae bacterium]|nr:type II secretion system protein [Lachnospiraceae bacterium]
MFKQKLRKDHRGLTLVELVVAVSILSIITATLGGAMVVASNSYRRGTVESSLQQEAQFTANSIEGLIIDATTSLTWESNVLTIVNTDYTYQITYNSSENKLLYSQQTTPTTEGGAYTVIASNELLAEHVSGFNVYGASDFSETRNASISLTMENGGSKFTTNYNITSRNNPNSGDSSEVVANIYAPSSVVIEPNQNRDTDTPFFIPVSVYGPSDTDFNGDFANDDYEDGTSSHPAATATKVEGGFNIKVQNSETGGEDGLLDLVISTTATDAAGDALATKHVMVKIRRVRTMSVSQTHASPTGEDWAKDTVYTVHSSITKVTFPDVVAGASYDADYVSPYDVIWEFEKVVIEGVEYDYTDYVEVTSDASSWRSADLRFKLKADIPEGGKLTLKAVSLHSRGTTNSDGTGYWHNKTGLPYDEEVFAKLEIEHESSGDGLLRGDENSVAVASGIDSSALVATYNHHSYVGGWTGNILYRYIASDGQVLGTGDTSAGYPGWQKMGDQGYQPTSLEFKMKDVSGMAYTRPYKLQVCYSFKYEAFDDHGNRVYDYFPAGSGTTSTFHLAEQKNIVYNADGTKEDKEPYIYEFNVAPFQLKFTDVVVGQVWRWPDVIPGSSYAASDFPAAGGTGIGSVADGSKAGNEAGNKYLTCYKGAEITLKFNYVGGEVSKDNCLDSLLQSSQNCVYKYNESTGNWDNTGNREQPSRGSSDKNSRTGELTIKTQNYPGAGLYKLVLDKVKGEQYGVDPGNGAGSKGVIYFRLVD